jgi:hypothetical protein
MEIFRLSIPNGVAVLIEVRADVSVGVSRLALILVVLVVVEIWGEDSPHGAFFGCGGFETWNNFVRSGGMVV